MLTLEIVGQLEEVIHDLDKMYQGVVREAERMNIEPFMVMSRDGLPLLAPIVIAKAHALLALTQAKASR